MKDIETIKEQAKKGDVQSQVELAHAYLNGEGTIKNRGLYLKWLESAARQGHLESRLELVEFYSQKRNKYANPNLALYWMHEAQKLGATFTDEQLLAVGDPTICTQEIEKLLFGEGKAHDFTKAKELILRISLPQEKLSEYAKRYYDIYHNDGKMLSNISYLLKLSFNRDHEKLNEYAVELAKSKAKNSMKIAFSLFSEAYSLGNPYAASSYLYCLLNGKGCKKDINKGTFVYFNCKQKNVDTSRAFASKTNKGIVAKLPNSLAWKINCLLHKAENAMEGVMHKSDVGIGMLITFWLYIWTPIRMIGTFGIIISTLVFIGILKWDYIWCISIRCFFENIASKSFVGYIILYVLLILFISISVKIYKSIQFRNELKRYGVDLPPFILTDSEVVESTTGCFGPSTSTTIHTIYFIKNIDGSRCGNGAYWVNPSYPLETMDVKITFLSSNKAEITLGYWYEP